MEESKKKEILRKLDDQNLIDQDDKLTLQEIYELFFEEHSVKETSKDLDKMFFSFIGSESSEMSIDRQTSIESWIVLKKILYCIENKIHPSNVEHLTFSPEL